MIPSPLLLSLATIAAAAASPAPTPLAEPIHVPLSRRALPSTSVRFRKQSDWKAYREFVLAKFAPNTTLAKRIERRQNSADVPLTDLGFDTTYFASISIGTPGSAFNVILDTGSSDLWVSSQDLSPSSSSTLQTSQQIIDLQYGSGEARGSLAQDTVSMGGFTISKQQFVLADQVSQGLLQGSLNGLLGLGFDTIAQTKATPFVEALAKGGQLKSQEMSFQLARLITSNNAPQEAPGGTFTIGGTNSSLFQGDIDFVNLPSNVQPSFWLLPVTAVGVQGTTLTVTAGQQSLAAIDTGTTLIGGPTQAVAEIYSHIQGSQALSGEMQGYFTIPCSTSVQTSFTFSSKTWPINPADFNVQQLSNTDCLGAFFGLDLGAQGGPDWVIGDTFLKNVYSVFRFSPGPSVGFAQLAGGLQDPSSTANTPAQSRTITEGPLPTGSDSGSSPTPTNNPFGPGSGSGPGGSTPSGAAAGMRPAALVGAIWSFVGVLLGVFVL